jgi:putative peptide zinc metalloprotease protein
MTHLTKEPRTVNRITRSLLSGLVAAGLLLAPSAAGASDENIVVATNESAGTSVVEAGVQYRIAPNGVVDEENRAYAAARCADCQTVAAAFQIVLVTREFRDFVPLNEAFAANVECEECLTWASAKQIIVMTGGPASLSGNGHQRMQALEERIEALEPALPGMALVDLQAELNAAFDELLDIASTEVVLHDGSPANAEIAATRQS